MKEQECCRCGHTVALNESVEVRGEPLCLPCAENAVGEYDDLAEGDIVRHLDPTICAACGKDGGRYEWDRKLDLPICPECTPTFGNVPFPSWIKLSAAVLALLVVLSFVLNLRFWKASGELHDYWDAMNARDYRQAEQLAASAREHVPEISELQFLSYFSEALILYEDGRPREASDKFALCKTYFPPEFGIDELMLEMRRTAAFDEGNYDEFLALSRAKYDEAPQERMNVLSMASAFACKFVETGDEYFRTQARDMIRMYEMADGPEDTTSYVMRVEHRLYTREILRPEEFFERYPDGWENPERSE